MITIIDDRHDESRNETRHPFHWSVAIVFDSAEDRDTYHGVTHDISMQGCSILMDDNVFSEEPVTLLIAMPIEHPGDRQRIVEVRARMVYTLLAAGVQQFRCGIRFQRFKGAGRTWLNKAIQTRIEA